MSAPSLVPPPLDLGWSLEDPDVLVQALRPAQAQVVLVPAGAGDDALTLLLGGARRVIGVSPSAGQLALAELKLAAVRTLDQERLLAALGLRPSTSRAALLHRAAEVGGLSAHGRAWVQARAEDLPAGIVHSGSFERAAAALRQELSWSVRAGTMARMLGEWDADARARRLARVTGGRWRIAFRMALRQALPGVPASLVRQRVEAAVTRGPDFQALWLLVGRCVDPEDAHPYLAQGAGAALAQAGSLELVQGDLVSALGALRPASLDAVSLGLAEALPGPVDRALAAAARALRAGGRLLLRSCGPVPPLGGAFVVDVDDTHRLTALDRCLASRGLVVAQRA